MFFKNFLPAVLAVLSLSSCSREDQGTTVRTSATAHLYVTSQNDGNVTRYDINSGERTTYKIPSTDSQGIYYSQEDNTFTIISRSSSRLETYTGIDDLEEGESHELTPAFFGPDVMEDPRDLAVSGDLYVVSDNIPVKEDPDDTDPAVEDEDDDNSTGDEEEEVEEEEEITYTGRFWVYIRNASGFMLRNVIDVDFEVRGIEFVGDDLYSVIYNSNNLVVFENFGNIQANRNLEPSKTISIEGMLRSQDLDFEEGTMVLTDIADDDSDSDGAYNIIPRFESKFNATIDEGIMPLSEQLRVSGDNTRLGNPINVAFDAAYNTIFIAEAANGDGRVLGFTDAVRSEGNGSPRFNKELAGASSLYFHTGN